MYSLQSTPFSVLRSSAGTADLRLARDGSRTRQQGLASYSRDKLGYWHTLYGERDGAGDGARGGSIRKNKKVKKVKTKKKGNVIA